MLMDTLPPFPSFTMTGARTLLTITSGAVHLEQQVIALERAVRESPNLAPDLARTLVETICKTILTDKGETYDGLNFNSLLNRIYETVQLVPDAKLAAETTKTALKDLIGQLNGSIQCISRLRHEEGLASHGKDAYFTALEAVQAEFIAMAADTLITFLYRAHRVYSGGIAVRRLEYDRHPEENEYIDSYNEVIRIFDYQYRPSEVLFNLDPLAYTAVLDTFSPSADDDELQSEV
jgi:hypothetical protein